MFAFYDRDWGDYKVPWAPLVLNPVGGGGAVCLVGRVLNQKGSWWKAMIGAGVGSLVGTAVFMTIPVVHTYILYLALPPLGATIGYNL